MSRIDGRVAFSVLCALALVSGSGRAAPPPLGLRVRGDTIEFVGELKGSAASDLLQRLSDQNAAVRTLAITSPGGEGPDAIAIARVVHARGVDVVVRGFCISACAQYVFAAGRRKVISKGSIIAFHSSATALAEYLRAAGQREGAAVFAAQEKNERDFYRTVGVDVRLPLLAAAKMRPMCYVIDARNPAGDPNRYGLGWGAVTVIPTRAQLASLGINDVEGTWPTAAELPSVLRSLGFREAYRPVYEPDAVTMLGAAGDRLPSLPACSDLALKPRPR